MKKPIIALTLLCLAIALAGCNSISSAGIKSYLDGIPVQTPDLSAMPDGVYSGSYSLAVPPGAIAVYHAYTVAVAVKAGRVDSVSVTKPRDMENDDVYKAVIAGPNGVIARQRLDVDALTGASFSSKALVKAVEKALSP